ncbi:Crossover junction endonuclease EME1B [Apostasia shenzhenica]|uniref:Crossover junction endonuclease EME1B n=1 Tax=Apostasia shenzhenica TaxID=1088818 RepID=A0A2H9ZX49_9ASPA|nr:Crossover junction endonuclease EME1B [Apostasia shenzhenica]
MEERKQKKQEEKKQKEALRAEAAELKKLEKEKLKWEKGKFALKSILAEIDSKVLESGAIGGHLLAKFAERGISFRITSNPIGRSILWKMSVPEQIAKLSNMVTEVPYILLVYQAEEFCDLVISESLLDHVQRVRTQYPLFTVCYLTNKLMSFINKCEQSQYKNSSKFSGWKRPRVEEAFARLATHCTKVHSRLCMDEAEIADHIVGLTTSLASCQFRKKLTWLSVNANGSIVSKDFIDRNLIKKNIWLKALVAIPKVQPRHAVAIWKKYPTMRSLLNAYMDPTKSVHEKEFLLKDLMLEGSLGREDRRLGEVCSKRIYRILMAQSGSILTDDVEDGADFFG